jgi:hypothetical protein
VLPYFKHTFNGITWKKNTIILVKLVLFWKAKYTRKGMHRRNKHKIMNDCKMYLSSKFE